MTHTFQTGLSPAEERDFAQTNWWLHDAHWYAAVAARWGVEEANVVNLQAIERAARGAVLQLRRRGMLSAPVAVAELETIFRLLWRLFFSDGMYQAGVFSCSGDTAEWVGTECHAFQQVKRAGLQAQYRCGCAAFRDGVRKGLGAAFEHEIIESLMQGGERCVVRFRMNGGPGSSGGPGEEG